MASGLASFLKVRLLTYKVVNDANDALNVFAEMVSIKLALQSLKESMKKIVFLKFLFHDQILYKKKILEIKIINLQSVKIAHIVQHAVR